MKRKILIGCAAAAILFAWIHSAMPSGISGAESGWFAEHIINPVWTLLFGQGMSIEIVRKLAHVFEYTVIGALLGALLQRKPLPTFGIGMAVAVTDETIQLLSGRGSTIADVWIDLCGVAIGYGIAWGIYGLTRKRNGTNAS